MKALVVYYSNKGSNKFLAEKISERLSCDIEEIRPRLDVFTFFLMNIHMGIKSLKHNLEEYSHIILCGPIWMGKFIPPLRSFTKNYKDKIQKLIPVFVVIIGILFIIRGLGLGIPYVSPKAAPADAVTATIECHQP